MRRLVLYCDESIGKGAYYSNFFGAALVEEKKVEYVNKLLRAKLTSLNIFDEVKFARITTSYQTKYQDLMVEFFKLVKNGDIKIRIMFTHNLDLPKLTAEQQKKNRYFLLYYQLIKHSFGLQYMQDHGPVMVLLNFDVFPQTKQDIAEFKQYLCGLTEQPEFKVKGINFSARNIAEVDSSKHLILQCLDIIMGSIQCRLNNGHKQKTPGTRFISKRAKAKAAVYKTILEEIKELYPGYAFNIGETTAFADSSNGFYENRWLHPYRHWKFKPKESERNASYVAKNKRGGSARPT